MENLQSTNAVQERSYFKGWFIALRNYEVFEIEAIKEKWTSPLIEQHLLIAQSCLTTSGSK